MTPHDGGPAFPIVEPGFAYRDGSSEQTVVIADGMSLRDWFAGMALQGLLAGARELGVFRVNMSAEAFALADAMLQARKPEKAKP